MTSANYFSVSFSFGFVFTFTPMNFIGFPERTGALGATASRVFSRWDAGIDGGRGRDGSILFSFSDG